MMQNSRLYEMIQNIKSGTIFRITYRTEVPVSAAYKKEGVHIYKIVSQCTRTGVSYNNIQDVIESRASEQKSSHKSYCFPVVINRIYEHKTNGTRYLRLARVNKHSNTVVSYMYEKAGIFFNIDEAEAIRCTLPSAWKHTGPAPVVKNIKLENVIAINNVFVD